MAGGDEFIGNLLGGDSNNRFAASLLFIGAGTNMYDAFSAVMSSPWSTEKFTQSPEEEKMAREYIRHAMTIGGMYAIGGAVIARSVWPLIGAGIATAYMYWLYDRAVKQSPNNGGDKSIVNPIEDTDDSNSSDPGPTFINPPLAY